MPGDTSVRARWTVETDVTDWPSGLPESERSALTRIVLAELRRSGPLPMHRLAALVSRRTDAAALCPTWHRATLWDFIYACVERAARTADCGEVFQAPPERPEEIVTTVWGSTEEYPVRGNQIRRIRHYAHVAHVELTWCATRYRFAANAQDLTGDVERKSFDPISDVEVQFCGIWYTIDRIDEVGDEYAPESARCAAIEAFRGIAFWMREEGLTLRKVQGPLDGTPARKPLKRVARRHG